MRFEDFAIRFAVCLTIMGGPCLMASTVWRKNTLYTGISGNVFGAAKFFFCRGGDFFGWLPGGCGWRPLAGGESVWRGSCSKLTTYSIWHRSLLTTYLILHFSLTLTHDPTFDSRRRYLSEPIGPIVRRYRWSNQSDGIWTSGGKISMME